MSEPLMNDITLAGNTASSELAADEDRKPSPDDARLALIAAGRHKTTSTTTTTAAGGTR